MTGRSGSPERCLRPSSRGCAPDTVDLDGRTVPVVPGLDDRIAPAERSREVARRLAPTGRVGYLAVPGARHAMLRLGSRPERYAADLAVATLLGQEPRSEAVRRALATGHAVG